MISFAKAAREAALVTACFMAFVVVMAAALVVGVQMVAAGWIWAAILEVVFLVFAVLTVSRYLHDRL